MLTGREETIARRIQGDIDSDEHPYRRIEQETGIPEREILDGIGAMLRRGVIRKFGAVVRHTRAGFTRNTMVLWAVPEDRCDSVGSILAAFPEVTHCYRRTPAFAERYNLFSMIHLRSSREEDQLLQKIASATGLTDYLALTSEEEFKKTSMSYF